MQYYYFTTIKAFVMRGVMRSLGVIEQKHSDSFKFIKQN